MGILALVIGLANFTCVLCAAEAPAVKPAVAEQATAPATDPASEEALKILTKAQKTMSEFKTFKADILNTSEMSKIKSKTIIYQRNNSDGVVEMRTDSEFEVGKVKHAQTFIVNREGQWILTPSSAIKMDFQSAMMLGMQKKIAGSAEFSSLKKEASIKIRYTCSDKLLNGRPCYVVIETLPPEAIALIKETLKNPETENVFKESKTTIDDASIPVLSVYCIGKSDFFIYSQQTFNKSGDKLAEVIYGNVMINVPLADDLFQVPKGINVKHAKTAEEFSAYMAGILR